MGPPSPLTSRYIYIILCSPPSCIPSLSLPSYSPISYLSPPNYNTPPLSTLLQVDITVEDTNDNAPDFGFSSFVYNLTENAAAGTVLAPTLLATDADEGTNGQVVYRISTGPFTVDANTGMEEFLYYHVLV